MSWPKVNFESLYAEPSRNGLTRPSRVRGSGCKMINMGELFGHDKIDAIPMELVPMTEKEQACMLVEKGDLLFARQSLVLSGAGKCSIVQAVYDPTTFESHIIRVRLKNEIALPLFFFYYFKSPISNMKSIVTQGVQAGIRGNDLKRLLVPLPPIQTQIKIASLISAYDDLIENNRRRIKLLEESARLLYREWFVHLRFPGHENTKIINGLPEGWKNYSAFELMEVMSGGTPNTQVADYWDGDIPFFTPKDVATNPYVFFTEKNLSDAGLKNCNSKRFPKNTIFITARGTVGKLCLAQNPMAMNQSCYALQAKGDLNQFFLFCALTASISQFRARASGAVFDAIVVNTFKLIPILLPTKCLIAEFSRIVSPFFEQIEKLLIQNHKLAEARDLLLPRLMSGELEV